MLKLCSPLSSGDFLTITARYINTELNQNIAKMRPEVKHYFTEAPPMKRMGETADLTGGLLYLLSDAASYVTGIDLPIDGGMCTGNGLTR
jgi:NAD(P)-dependent dehydrogenase (short-subunit alcohol dehydrogenase family)